MAVMNRKLINGWNLFLLVSVPMSLLTVIEMANVDLSTGPGVSHMIAFAVRFAVPLIFVVTAASALPVLFPGALPTWLLRNRKYIGMCFAVAMAWQGLFIFMMSTMHRDYYYEDIYFLRDELEGSTGYIFLAAMVLTTFRFGRSRLTPEQWKLLHRSGVYFLWAYAFSVYWWNLSYYPDPQPIDYVFYWAGFLAFALRIAAWGKRRLTAARRNSPGVAVPVSLQVSGGVVAAAGLGLAFMGLGWQAQMTSFLTAPAWSAALLKWLPYWPFEPFLSLILVGLGTWIGTSYPAAAEGAVGQTWGRTRASL